MILKWKHRIIQVVRNKSGQRPTSTRSEIRATTCESRFPARFMRASRHVCSSLRLNAGHDAPLNRYENLVGNCFANAIVSVSAMT
jgi:hypothetical protein